MTSLSELMKVQAKKSLQVQKVATFADCLAEIRSRLHISTHIYDIELLVRVKLRTKKAITWYQTACKCVIAESVRNLWEI